jgi:PhnB protein
MAVIQAYLFFENQQCKEAMEFYHSCIGGDLFLQTIAESPAKDHFPPEMHNNIMHASISKGDLMLMASDYMDNVPYKVGNNVSLSLTCDSREEMDSVFRKLAEGGSIYQEPKEEFWGDVFGNLTDKYGVIWMVVYTPKKEE